MAEATYMLNWTNFLITERESIHDRYLFIPVDTSPFVVTQLSIWDHDLQPVVVVASSPGLWVGAGDEAIVTVGGRSPGMFHTRLNDSTQLKRLHTKNTITNMYLGELHHE